MKDPVIKKNEEMMILTRIAYQISTLIDQDLLHLKRLTETPTSMFGTFYLYLGTLKVSSLDQIH